MSEMPRLSEIIRLCQARGATVRAYDPMAMPKAAALLPGVEMKVDAWAAADGADALLLITEWAEFIHGRSDAASTGTARTGGGRLPERARPDRRAAGGFALCRRRPGSRLQRRPDSRGASGRGPGTGGNLTKDGEGPGERGMPTLPGQFEPKECHAMRCMVTGAAGFIGSTLVDRLSG